MTAAFLVLLGLAWIAVILPATLRARQSAPLSATERFKRRMRLLAPRQARRGRWIVVPESTDRLARSSFRRDQRRRKVIFQALVGAAAVSLGAAALGGGPLWQIHFAFDVSLAFYVMLLLGTKRRRDEQALKVATLTPRAGFLDRPRHFDEIAQGG